MFGGWLCLSDAVKRGCLFTQRQDVVQFRAMGDVVVSQSETAAPLPTLAVAN
jgi:hypothetical protein